MSPGESAGVVGGESPAEVREAERYRIIAALYARRVADVRVRRRSRQNHASSGEPPCLLAARCFLPLLSNRHRFDYMRRALRGGYACLALLDGLQGSLLRDDNASYEGNARTVASEAMGGGGGGGEPAVVAEVGEPGLQAQAPSDAAEAGQEGGVSPESDGESAPCIRNELSAFDILHFGVVAATEADDGRRW